MNSTLERTWAAGTGLLLLALTLQVQRMEPTWACHCKNPLEYDGSPFSYHTLLFVYRPIQPSVNQPINQSSNPSIHQPNTELRHQDQAVEAS